MDLQGVMKQLKAWEHPKMRAVNAKHGAGDNQFGVNLGKLRGLAGKIKRDYTLALELWNHCLVKIAVEYPKLRKRAIAIGNKLEVLKDYPVPKGCTSPFAPVWIAYILEHRK